MEMWAVATLILIAGLIDDFRSTKIHNGLILTLFAGGIVASLYFRGAHGSAIGAATLVLSLVATVPLFAAGIWGGGDVKLFAVFAFAVDPITMFWTFVYSFVWGALFGVTRALLQNQLFTLVKNTYKLATRQKLEAQQIHKVPFSFAMLLGWFTQLTLLKTGGFI